MILWENSGGFSHLHLQTLNPDSVSVYRCGCELRQRVYGSDMEIEDEGLVMETLSPPSAVLCVCLQ